MNQRTINDVMDEYYAEEYLEDWTFRNIVLHIRKEELLRIMDGEKAVEVIPASNQRAKLLRDNVLEAYYAAGGKRIRVTDAARRLLEE